jgi:hypothetical protein
MQAPSKRQRRRLLQLLAFRAARLGVDVGVLQVAIEQVAAHERLEGEEAVVIGQAANTPGSR